MDHHVRKFYSQFHDDTPRGNFHKVIALHQSPEMTWEHVQNLIPDFSRGWFELAHLEASDRIEFLRDFWLSKLPYHPPLDEFINRFFSSLDDIGIYIYQRTFESPYETNMVYALQGDTGFFRGGLPASEEQISQLQRAFPNVILPADYLAFLQIHNGFWKTTDSTGILPTSEIPSHYASFQDMLELQGPISTFRGKPVNPKSLIPFYESFGMPFFQCFWGEWYPENEMGNVYYSGTTKAIFDVERSDPSSESMAFPTFLDWLMFYMERIQ